MRDQQAPGFSGAQLKRGLAMAADLADSRWMKDGRGAADGMGTIGNSVESARQGSLIAQRIKCLRDFFALGSR